MRRASLLVAMIAVVLVAGASAGAAGQTSSSDGDRAVPAMVSGGASERLAERSGASVQGKSASAGTEAPEAPGVETAATTDVRVSAKPSIHENEPSFAANPVNSNVVAAFHHIPSDPCHYAVSRNGGASYGRSIALPLTHPDDFCSDPVVRVSPDGAWFYIAYMSIRPDFTSDIAVFTIKGDLTVTRGPFIAVKNNGLDFFDKPWLDVHKFATLAAVNDDVYVSVTAFRGNGKCDIVFSRGDEYGTDWPSATSPTLLATSGGGCGDPVVVQGSRPIGGPGTNVLACWYNSERDGWGPGGGGPVFDIRCRTSANGGITFGQEVSAANDVRFEVPFWLCPNEAFHRAWGSMFPSLAIGPDGSAHVTFTHDPTGGDTDGECGNVLYTSSAGPPYTTWTRPSTLGTAPNSYQGYVAIGATSTAGGCRLDIAYLDHRFSPPGDPNLMYDVSHRRSDDCGATWSSVQRITDASSLSDFIFIGDYIDVTSNGTVQAIWTDRRDKTSIFDFEDDVFAEPSL